MNREKWTLFEKKKFLRLLSKYDIDDYQHIARHLPNKSSEDVKAMIETQVRRAKHKEKLKVKKDCKTEPEPEEDSTVDDIPAIDKWLKITQGLVNRESLDFSTHLSRVMGVIADFETFPSADPAAYRPNYREIYRYLGELLSGNEPHDLKPLESAVVLEVLHSLQAVLSGADTAVQRNIMKWKYQLIAAPKSDSREKMKYCRKVVENDFTDFIRQQEETGEPSDSESEEEIDELFGNTYHSNVGTVKKARGRPRKSTTEMFTPYVCDRSNDSVSARNHEEKEVIRMEEMTWNRRKKKPHVELEEIDKTGHVVVRRSDRPGQYVQIKPEKAELTDKKQLTELQEYHRRVVKRKEYTYRPPPKEPEVVLVMPPVDKPIVQLNVRDRNFKCSLDGKYKSLGKATAPTIIPNKKIDTQEVAIDETGKVRVENHDRSLYEKDRARKYNAAVHKLGGAKLSAKDIEEASNYRYEPRTARKEHIGSIRVKLPVKSVDGNVAVEFPVANIERTGNIHVQLSATNIENANANVKPPNAKRRKTGSVTFGTVTEEVPRHDSIATNTEQETNHDLSEDPSVIETEVVPCKQQSIDAPSTITEAPPNLTEVLPILTEAPPIATETPPTLTAVPPTLNQAPPTITQAPPAVAEDKHVDSQASQNTLDRLAKYVRTKSVEHTIPSSPKKTFKSKTFKILTSSKSSTPVPPGSRRVILITKPPPGSASSAGPSATVMPGPGPASSVKLTSGSFTPDNPSKKLSTLTVLPTGKIISTPSESREISKESMVPSSASTQPMSRTALMAQLNATVQKRLSEKMDKNETASTVQSSAINVSAMQDPGHQALNEASNLSSTRSLNMHTSGPDNQIVLTGSELPVIPVTRSEEQINPATVSGVSQNRENNPAIVGGVSENRESGRKRRAFDKTRYKAFVKDNEMTKYKAPKKPKLYSLNPFCVPISLLDIGK